MINSTEGAGQEEWRHTAKPLSFTLSDSLNLMISRGLPAQITYNTDCKSFAFMGNLENSMSFGLAGMGRGAGAAVKGETQQNSTHHKTLGGHKGQQTTK